MSENRIETISVSQFVKEYKEIPNEGQKKAYIKKHVIRTYCPLLDKMNMLKVMNDKSVVNDENGKYIDMTVSKLNTVISILVLYTDVRPDKDENEKNLSWQTYDLLKSTKLLERILEIIGDDINELMLVQKDVMDTWYTKNASTEAVIRDIVDKAIEKLGVVAGVGMQELSAILDDDKKLNNILFNIGKFLKK